MVACMRKKKGVSYETRTGMSVGEIRARSFQASLATLRVPGALLKERKTTLWDLSMRAT